MRLAAVTTVVIAAAALLTGDAAQDARAGASARCSIRLFVIGLDGTVVRSLGGAPRRGSCIANALNSRATGKFVFVRLRYFQPPTHGSPYGHEESQLWLSDDTGRHQRPIGRSYSAWDAWPSWSPDGRRLAYVEADYSGCRQVPKWCTQQRIHLIDMRGREAVPIEGRGRGVAAPAWSRGGRLLAFADDLDIEGGLGHAVAVARPNGSARREVVAARGIVRPTWAGSTRSFTRRRTASGVSRWQEGRRASWRAAQGRKRPQTARVSRT
jgi:WD40-like Beta Propeller Repeat